MSPATTASRCSTCRRRRQRATTPTTTSSSDAVGRSSTMISGSRCAMITTRRRRSWWTSSPTIRSSPSSYSTPRPLPVRPLLGAAATGRLAARRPAKTMDCDLSSTMKPCKGEELARHRSSSAPPARFARSSTPRRRGAVLLVGLHARS
ncbi:Os11g0223720 [Oryza sativa Japonica Group]|uniref:Os11g0223720 protein n=1 Tax=Oryza sativa subsp. japonica TaxID=39947 RepID=A0A0P0Y0A3_ORYSJ|nr:Os11g0223720 [Oryza sativa Japonica Group]